MRNGLKTILTAVAVTVLAQAGVSAQDATVAKPEPQTTAAAGVDACASDPSRLGLSRVVEIDTAGGPQFGGEKGHVHDFLKAGEVVLTFDDGPMRHYTRTVLKALAEHCTKATFFMVGRMAASDPAMVKEVANAGHTVATHTWSHKNLGANNLVKGRQDFEMGLSAVNRALGASVSPFFRFPYLGDNRQVGDYLKERNVASWWVDIDSKDYFSRDPNGMQRRVLAALAAKGKGIILMHDIQPATANGLKGLLDQLHAKGFKVVHIVAKAPTATIAEFDSAVEKSFKTKSATAAANPLADRSVMWTETESGAGALAEPAVSVKPIGGPKSAPSVRAKPASTEAELPWLEVDSSDSNPSPAGKAASKPKKAAPTGEVLPWQPSTFGY
jgi:peptidoglycan-N-acetylglucosamine deacetylase